MSNRLGAVAAYESLVVHGNSTPTAEDVCNEATRMIGLKYTMACNGVQYFACNTNKGKDDGRTALEQFLATRFTYDDLFRCIMFRTGELVQNKASARDWTYGIVKGILRCGNGSFVLAVMVGEAKEVRVDSERLLHTVVPADIPAEIMDLAKCELRRSAERDLAASEVKL